MPPLSGSEFRDDIARILKTKYIDVRVEVRLVVTTADVLYVDDTNPIFTRKIAIEAKDWSSPLTSSSIAKIENLYRPSLSSGEIDFLWIISKHSLSSSPNETIKRLRNIKYSTIEEFRSSMMNFSGVLQDNILEYEQSPVSKMYIHTRVKNCGSTLFDYTLEWLSNDQSGLIVFGGYGLGKTTFSMYLSSKLSLMYNKGEFNRIPIRIPLGRMYSKQDISSLVCSALSGGDGKASVRDFSYHLFIEANSLGHYLLILDGFDEMKHAMTTEDFVYTFEQMKPLFSKKSKVIILGRPDSFLSSEDEKEVLSNLFDTPQTHINGLDQVEIEYFSDEEIARYLDKFYQTRPELHNAESKNRYDWLIYNAINDSDVLHRPVQLKMFTEIVDLLLEKKDARINRYELYRQFIHKFIIRENRKNARKIGGSRGDLIEFNDDRALFMINTAWWVMSVKKENRFLADDIPLSLVPKSIKDNRDDKTAVREIVVGSVIEQMDKTHVLDKKGNRYYYFPHKSYMEFLVAQYFCISNFAGDDLKNLLDCINSEIVSFIAEGPQSGISKFRGALSYVSENVSMHVINVCLLDESIGTEISSGRASDTPLQIYIHYLYRLRNNKSSDQYLLQKLKEERALGALISVLNCFIMDITASDNINLGDTFLVSAFNEICSHSLISPNGLGIEFIFLDFNTPSLYAAILKHCVTIDKNKSWFYINISIMKKIIKNTTRNILYVDLSPNLENKKIIKVKTSHVLSKLPAVNRKTIHEFIYLEEAGNYVFSRIQLKGAAEDRFQTY